MMASAASSSVPVGVDVVDGDEVGGRTLEAAAPSRTASAWTRVWPKPLWYTMATR